MTFVFAASYLCASDPMFRAMMRLSRQADLMSQRYVGELHPDRIFADAWRSMQTAIPFHVELVSDSSGSASERKLGDWGLLLSSDRGVTNVVSVTEGSLFSGTLRPGDRVKSIGLDTTRLIDNLRRYLTSKVGDSLLISIERGDVIETVKVIVPLAPEKALLTFSRLDNIVYCGINAIVEHMDAPLHDSLQLNIDESTKGLVIDLRGCQDDSEEGGDDVLREFLGLRPSLPFVLLVDQLTGRQGEKLVRQLLKREQVTVAGDTGHPLRAVTEAIELQSGNRLYVYRGERNEDYYYNRDSLVDDSLSNPLVSRRGLTESTVPEIACEPPELSGLTVDLLHRGLMLDFAAASSYKTLPSLDEEAQLFDAFTSFLHAKGYAYDPLGEAFRDLEISGHKPALLKAIDNIRNTLRAQPSAKLDDLRNEIVPLLLLYIQQVKIGGEPSLADRLRIDDICLQAAITYLQKAHS
jgi:hypothetical protein